MKQTYNSSVWRDDAGSLIGLNLGSDYCAEHEWGIAGIANLFGINSSLLGIAGKSITKNGDKVIKVCVKVKQLDRITQNSLDKRVYGISIALPYSSGNNFLNLVKDSIWQKDETEMLAFWSSSRFLVLLEKEEEIDHLIDAFNENNIAIWIGGGASFQNGGLCIVMKSNLPEEFKTTLLEKDTQHKELYELVESCGIKNELFKANKKYFSLIPEWKNHETREIKFWLTPTDSGLYNSGWFTLAELKEWIEEKGPILK